MEEMSAKVSTLGELRKFLEGLADDMPFQLFRGSPMGGTHAMEVCSHQQIPGGICRAGHGSKPNLTEHPLHKPILLITANH
jgi:hypothetical protein